MDANPAEVLSDARSQGLFRQLAQLDRDQQFPTIVRWLTGKDTLRRAIALTTLSRVGAPAVSLLLKEAMKPRKGEQTRLRLLEAVEKIGVPLQPDEFLDLTIMASRFSPAVQQQIARVIVANRKAYIAQQDQEARARSAEAPSRDRSAKQMTEEYPPPVDYR